MLKVVKREIWVNKRWGKTTEKDGIYNVQIRMDMESLEVFSWIQAKVFMISPQLLCDFFLIILSSYSLGTQMREYELLQDSSQLLSSFVFVFIAFIIQAISLLSAMMHVAQIPWPEAQWLETVINGDPKLWWICNGHVQTFWRKLGSLGYVGAIDYIRNLNDILCPFDTN